MMRWIMLLVALAGLGMAYTTKSPGTLAMGLLLLLIGSTGFVFSLIAAKVSSNTRSQVYVPSAEELALLKRKAERQRMGTGATVNTTPSAPSTPLPPIPTSGAPKAKPEWKRANRNLDGDLDESV